ncbi:hypothetical protein CLV99_2390 [Sphingobacterium yanglingense]|uniref:Uncharacterized protein n=1 Tax=Sphingobacterium yanglingense TaxID=1437280 RepID=A0A4R6WBU2_9SPHI|nr:hypothetical protein CLV99_2390 [Sphingobacterium yanglingense]
MTIFIYGCIFWQPDSKVGVMGGSSKLYLIYKMYFETVIFHLGIGECKAFYLSLTYKSIVVCKVRKNDFSCG